MVTGATSVYGRAFALDLARRGFNLYLVYVTSPVPLAGEEGMDLAEEAGKSRLTLDTLLVMVMLFLL